MHSIITYLIDGKILRGVNPRELARLRPAPQNEVPIRPTTLSKQQITVMTESYAHVLGSIFFDLQRLPKTKSPKVIEGNLRWTGVEMGMSSLDLFPLKALRNTYQHAQLDGRMLSPPTHPFVALV